MSRVSGRRVAVLVATVLLAAPLPSGSAYAAQHPPSGVVFGDSITYEGASALRALRPGWDVVGVRGREAGAYPRLARRYHETYARPPRRLVLALGTNELGASRQLYRDAVADLPPRSTVVLVSTFRDPAVFGERRAQVMAAITRWMNRVAASRPRTCVAPWRARVVRDPGLLRDGVHATPRGRKVWARMVSRTMARCELEAVSR